MTKGEWRNDYVMNITRVKRPGEKRASQSSRSWHPTEILKRINRMPTRTVILQRTCCENVGIEWTKINIRYYRVGFPPKSSHIQSRVFIFWGLGQIFFSGFLKIILQFPALHFPRLYLFWQSVTYMSLKYFFIT